MVVFNHPNDASEVGLIGSTDVVDFTAEREGHVGEGHEWPLNGISLDHRTADSRVDPLSAFLTMAAVPNNFQSYTGYRPIAVGHDRRLTGCSVRRWSGAIRGGLQRALCRPSDLRNASPIPAIDPHHVKLNEKTVKIHKADCQCTATHPRC